MKSPILLLLLLCLFSCQSVSIKNRKYKVADATTEIASIGQSKSFLYKNDFSTKVFPILENKIRVDLSIVPFNKKLNKTYLQKTKFNQNQPKVNYVDSLETKPEMITLSILDMQGYISEINSEQNQQVLTYLKDTKKSKVITSIATTLSSDNIEKIRQADTYYLTNSSNKKYTLVLYKENKKIQTIDLQSGIVIGYELSKCCWALNKKHQWYLADIVKECNSCKGSTYSKIKENKQNKSLFKM
ncbi:hypothetical protein [Flavobacterium sp.]|uniref:hypothetical protein n=1 Tax=Flavobacterium sp. TaxID=239 RepID=UPI0026198D8B|nr:hypothetical protein [Flavobacterium sp.]